jgi:hypothetical protein
MLGIVLYITHLSIVVPKQKRKVIYAVFPLHLVVTAITHFSMTYSYLFFWCTSKHSSYKEDSGLLSILFACIQLNVDHEYLLPLFIFLRQKKGEKGASKYAIKGREEFAIKHSVKCKGGVHI